MKRHPPSSKPLAPPRPAPALADGGASLAAEAAGQELRRQLQELQDARDLLQKQNQTLIELQRIRDEIDEVLQRYTDLYDFAPIGYYTLDCAGTLIDANLIGAGLLGISREQTIGRSFADFVTLEYRDQFVQFLQRVFADDAKQTVELPLLRPNAPPFFVHIEANSHDSGQSCRAVAIDISERKSTEERLQYLAHHDLLTGLPNRALFSDRLHQALARARRDGQHLGLIFLDLDKFKAVNDELGHDIGDLLLKEIARRMQACVRGADTVARLGGDEFVILLPYDEPMEDVVGVGHKLLAALERPFHLEQHEVHISASLGTALFPEHGADEEDLIRHADAAMYRAKQQGGGKVVSYELLAPAPGD